ncbi:kxDL motif-containing protein 1-like [Antedon mediterranea]|uniref:kxDL motif-containing protein 1-like n=1 Tax=Antedon mediterranea TaxID=105859 RepID=UPI003AF71A8D
MSKSGGSDVFIESLNALVNEDDMNAVLLAQKQMLERFEKTNEMLSKFNQLSVNQYETLATQFKGHTALLLDMRKDIDGIFRRIRILKTKLSTEYPDAFNVALENTEPEAKRIQQMSTSPRQDSPRMILDSNEPNDEDDMNPSSVLHSVPSIN